MDENEEDLFPTLVEAPQQPQLDLEDEVELSDEEVLEEENIVPEIKPKIEKINQNEMFISEKPKKNVKVKIVDDVEEDEPPTIAPVKPVKKKRVMSEAHKAKLALSRQKANEARSRKALEKKKMKEIERQTNELQKKKKEKDLEELKEEVEKPVSKKVETQQNNSTISKEDIEKIQLDAIMKYETLRKARKAEKKEKEKLEAQKNALLRKINPQPQQTGYRARDTSGRLVNRWDMCY